MSNAGAFKDGIKVLTGNDVQMTEGQEVEYMSDVNNWVLVHATKYMPLKNENGQFYIPTTAMATKFEIPRSTVHFTLNHIVTNHGYGSWDNADIVIMTPYNDAVKMNGNPAEVSVHDTYFSPDVTGGMLLPDGTHIVRPVYDLPDGQLFEVRGNETVYKSLDFTDDEIQILLPMLGWGDRDKYNAFANADFNPDDLGMIIESLGDAGKKFYENAKNKKEFLVGVFESARHAILGLRVREMAMRETMKVMGQHNVRYVSDLSNVAQSVAKVAQGMGLQGNISNKGHSGSVYAEIELVWKQHEAIMNGNWFLGDGLNQLIEKEKPLDSIYDYLSKYITSGNNVRPYVRALLDGKLLGVRQWCQDVIVRHGGAKDTNLVAVVDKWATKAEWDFAKFNGRLRALPGYRDFYDKLQQLQSSVTNQVKRDGRE